MRRPCRRCVRFPATVLAAALAVAAATAALAGAATVPGLQAERDALRASADRAVLELYASQSALDRARAESARLSARSAALAAREASARRRAVLARRSVRGALRRVQTAVRTLYVEGDVDPVAVILGATSLEAVLEGIDGLGRATRHYRRLAAELRVVSGRLERLREVLAGRRRALDDARRRAAGAAARLEGAVLARRATVAELRRRADLTDRQLSTLEAQASAASAASARISAPPAPTGTPGAVTEVTAPVAFVPAVSARPPSGESRQLVVSAIAYHLPGRTASGLPVGRGVIAVDPRVIPLGTRVYVPGYGPAVAADVGSAIIGTTIDLWMPSTADARAWGRRTVTITVYG